MSRRKEKNIFPLSEQSKRNIGEGKVLANKINRGELPFDTTLAEAREFGLDLSKKPRKGVRKKGLLPEITKKEYKEQLGKKIKEFSKEEKRIYNALAQREKRGYVPKTELSDELDDFLAETEEEEAIVPEPQLAIPKGVSSVVATTTQPEGDYSSEDDTYDEGDIEFISILTGKPELTPKQLRQNRADREIKEVLEANTSTRMSEKLANTRKAIQFQIVGGGQSKEERAEMKEKIRKRNKQREEDRKRQLIEKEQRLAKELEEELLDFGEDIAPPTPTPPQRRQLSTDREQHYIDLMRGMNVAQYRAETQRTIDFIDRYSALPEVRKRVGFAPKFVER